MIHLPFTNIVKRIRADARQCSCSCSSPLWCVQGCRRHGRGIQSYPLPRITNFLYFPLHVYGLERWWMWWKVGDCRRHKASWRCRPRKVEVILGARIVVCHSLIADCPLSLCTELLRDRGRTELELALGRVVSCCIHIAPIRLWHDRGEEAGRLLPSSRRHRRG